MAGLFTSIREKIRADRDRRYFLARKLITPLLRFEAVLILLLIAYLGISALVKDVSAPAAVIAEVIFGIFAAMGLFLAARAFQKGAAFGQAPAVLANGIALGVSYFMMQGRFLAFGIPLGCLALITFLSALFGYRAPVADEKR